MCSADSIKIGILTENLFHCFQVLCSIVAVICTNMAGIYTHWPREKAQRKAFIETRQCIEARLRTQRENQQQVTEILTKTSIFTKYYLA